MRSTLSPSSDWSVGGMCLLPVTAAEVGALAIAAGAGTGGWPVLTIGGASAAATLTLVTRAQMPSGARVAQVAAVVLALMVLAVRLDPFGLHAVEAAVTRAAVTTDTITATGRVPEKAATRASLPTVSIRAEGDDPDGIALALSAALAEALPTDAPRIDGAISHEFVSGLSATALHWSLVRGADVRPCGTLRVTGARRDLVVLRLRDAILAAARASGGQALACF